MTSKRNSRILWSVTVFVAVALLAFTIILTAQANAQGGEDSQHVRAYLSSEQPFVILLAEPEYRSTVISIQTTGTAIIVTDYLRRSGEDWYQIDINEMESGWVQERYISLEQP